VKNIVLLFVVDRFGLVLGFGFSGGSGKVIDYSFYHQKKKRKGERKMKET
jgi:hypothetical protein